MQTGAPLRELLRHAAAVVQEVRAGRSASAALSQVMPALRPGVQSLSYTALRRLGLAQALRERLVARPPSATVDALLCTTLALMTDDNDAPYPPHTLVSQAVESAKHTPRGRAQAGFLNACLRRFLREREGLLSASQNAPQALWNHPDWWIAQLQHDWPQHWQALLWHNQQSPPMTLRVNRRRCTVAELQARLAAAGLTSTRVGGAGLVLDTPRPVQQVPGFEQGWWSVQDAAAQQAAPLLLGPQPARGLRVLDACAAPGGKTAHLLELADDATVLALDADATRGQRIHDTLQRLGLHAQVRCADARQPETWWDGQRFDAILLDAPCSGSGVVRRHPDIRWLRRASDITQLAHTQAALLAALWPLLTPGGRLLYCTCSILRAEGDAVIGAFLAHNTDARLLPSPGALLPLSATNGGDLPDNPHRAHDGFYYALLEKVARA